MDIASALILATAILLAARMVANTVSKLPIVLAESTKAAVVEANREHERRLTAHIRDLVTLFEGTALDPDEDDFVPLERRDLAYYEGKLGRIAARRRLEETEDTQ
jgi:hypothetical protein